MAVARESGLGFVRDINWGTHVCQFYKTKQDLIDILVPYFSNGLRNNEFCIWVTSEFLTEEEAISAMSKAMPDFSKYLENGQMEIFPHTDWYLKEGKFELHRVLKGWVEKHDKAIAAGYAGMRVTGNPFWIDNKKDWDDFQEYEDEINNTIDDYKMLALCTYALDKCGADEIVDVVTNHKCAMIKRSGKWTAMESSANKKMDEALRKSESRFVDLYSSMTEGVAFHEIIYDTSGKAVDYVITGVNPAYERVTGLCKIDAVGKRASELYGTGDATNLYIYAQVSSTGKPTTFETYFPQVDKHFSISCTSSSRGRFTTVFHDITKRKKAEEALLQAKAKLQEYTDNLEVLVEERTEALKDAERLAAIGATAGMVGHDIRNPLQAIIGDLYLIKEELENTPQDDCKQSIQESLGGIEENIFYINKIVSDLQDYTKPVNPNIENVNLRDLINSTIILINIPENIETKIAVEGNLSLKVDAFYLRRILTNLTINAMQAMPKGGNLTINAVSKKDKVNISVEDSGVGIPEDVRAKLFMPLFTTKSKGQGLGLAVVKRFVEGLNGKIAFESQEGNGTKFIIELPLETANTYR